MRFTILALLSVSGASISPVFNFPSCSICPTDGDSPTNADLMLPTNTAGILVEDLSCMEVQSNAMEGDYSPFACTILQEQIAEDCGCGAMTPVAPPVEPPVAPPVEPPVAPPVMPPVVAPTEMPVVAPTEMPVVSPTEMPVVEPTDMPVMAPTELPVMAPTEMPVMDPTDVPVAAPPVETTVSISLDGVTELTDETSAALIEACEDYLFEQLPCVEGLTCEIQSATPARRFLRSLQEGLDVVFVISGETEDLVGGEFTEEVVDALNDPAFVEDLNETPGFEDVTGVTTVALNTEPPVPSPTAAPVVAETSAPVVADTPAPVVTGTSAPIGGALPPPVVSPTGMPVVPPTGAPAVAPVVAPDVEDEDDDDDGLGGGAIAGIVIAVAVVVGAIGAAVFYSSSGNNSAEGGARSAPAVEPVSEVVKSNSDMMNPPSSFQATKITKPPVASSAAVAAAASGSFVGDPSIIKTGSQIGAESGASDSSTAAGDTAMSGAMSSLKQSMLCREVEAPPGKLGIVIDTTLEGPVVHKISAESPLEGVVFPGDIIVAINDVDTRAMSASAITALMARTSNSRRVLTVLSEDVSN